MITAFWQNIEQHVRLVVGLLDLNIVACEDVTPSGTQYMGIQKQGSLGALVVVEFVKHGFDSKKAWQMVFNLSPDFVAAIDSKHILDSNELSFASVVQATSGNELLIQVRLSTGELLHWSPTQTTFVNN